MNRLKSHLDRCITVLICAGWILIAGCFPGPEKANTHSAETPRTTSDVATVFSMVPVNVVSTGAQCIQKWLAFGRLIARSEKDAIESDYLKETPGGDASLSLGDIRSCLAEDSGRKLHYAVSERFKAVDFHRTLGLDRPKDNSYEVFFAACELQCDSDRVVFATIGNDDGLQLSVNVRAVCRTREYHSVNSHPFGVPINLHKGKNLVIAKVANIKDSCGFSMHLMASEQEAVGWSMTEVGLLPKYGLREHDRPIVRFPNR